MLISLQVFLGPEQPGASWWWGLHSMEAKERGERAACLESSLRALGSRGGAQSVSLYRASECQ